VFPYAPATRTNLLFFSRNAPAGKIRFHRIPPPEGRRGFGKKTPIAPADVAGALAWIRDGTPDNQSWTISLDEVREGGYDLDLLPPEESEPPSPGELDVTMETASHDLGAFFDSLAPLAHGIRSQVDQYSFARMAKLGEFVEKRGAAAKSATITKVVGVSNTGGLLHSPGPLPSKTSRYKRVEVDDFVYNPMRVDVGSSPRRDNCSFSFTVAVVVGRLKPRIVLESGPTTGSMAVYSQCRSRPLGTKCARMSAS
jgi:type I restriction enzyme M protein